MPILAVAVGLYLPFELDSSIFIGGLIAWLLEKGYQKAQNSPLWIKLKTQVY